jgi:hypothetical protein
MGCLPLIGSRRGWPGQFGCKRTYACECVCPVARHNAATGTRHERQEDGCGLKCANSECVRNTNEDDRAAWPYLGDEFSETGSGAAALLLVAVAGCSGTSGVRPLAFGPISAPAFTGTKPGRKRRHSGRPQWRHPAPGSRMNGLARAGPAKGALEAEYQALEKRPGLARSWPGRARPVWRGFG